MAGEDQQPSQTSPTKALTPCVIKAVPSSPNSPNSDVMPTLAEVSGAKTPKNIDGISFLPTLLGKGTQKQHDFLYWEYMGQVAVRKGKWKAYMSRKKVWQLFDLDKDTLEENDLAKEHPDILKQMADFAKSAHIPAKGGGWIDSSQKFTRPKRKPRKKARPKK